MIPSAGNSLLAAQMYNATSGQSGVANDARVRRDDFQEAAKEARDLKASPEPARSFPVDRVELRQDPVQRAPLSQQAAVSENTALAAQEASNAIDTDDASRFAREAPGTRGPGRYEVPGSRLDISV